MAFIYASAVDIFPGVTESSGYHSSFAGGPQYLEQGTHEKHSMIMYGHNRSLESGGFLPESPLSHFMSSGYGGETDRKKKKKCHICGKELCRGDVLKTHMRTHTGIKPHQCPHCPSAFSDKSNLRRHVMTHTGEKPYQCDKCHRRYVRMRELAMHRCTTDSIHNTD